ncbi:RNA methyltransferase [bacterium]|nr:RNA methyltransferase [bacterium]
MREIVSKNNPILKHIQKLIHKASYRYAQKSVIITGDILIKEISTLLPIKTLLHFQENSLPAEKSFLVEKALLQKIVGMHSLQGPVAEVAMPSFVELNSKKKIAILDNITDPGNMGTLLRSALAFGIDGIHITKGSVDPFNDKVIRSSKGAVFKIPLSFEPYTNLDSKNFTCLLADMEGKDLKSLPNPKHPIAIVLSNETKGLNPKWEGEKVSIKMFTYMESLNVGVAGSIFFYELAKEAPLRDNS